MTRHEAQELLLGVAAQLDKWALESLTGGWSTHQVKPMINLALEIRAKVLIQADEEDSD